MEACEHCPDMRARLKFVEKLLTENLPELKGTIQDVQTCLVRMEETVNDIKNLKKSMDNSNARLKDHDEFIVEYRTTVRVMDKLVTKKLTILGLILTACIAFSSIMTINYTTHLQKNYHITEVKK